LFVSEYLSSAVGIYNELTFLSDVSISFVSGAKILSNDIRIKVRFEKN